MEVARMEMHRDWQPRRARLWGSKPAPVAAPPAEPTPAPPRVISPFVRKPRWARLFASAIEELDEHGNIVIEGFYMPHWKRITLEVCEKHQVGFNEIVSPRRDRAVVAARFEAMWRMTKETTMSLPAIGRRFSRDHTSVIHAVREHEKRIATVVKATLTAQADTGVSEQGDIT
jgi:hypothetical protein